MNTKILLASSAVFLGFLGIMFSFLPQEILFYVEINSNGIAPLFVQIFGALYIAFAIINWMVKTSLIGGIYNRPIATGNFLHFLMGSLALIKGISGVEFSPILIVFCVLYSIFAILFGIVLFRHPK
ncbi:MAG: hypothetical protein ABIG69_20755 [Bacteroidota bacterium]